MRVYGGDHWAWYNLPVPMRKWYINTYLKREQKNDTNKPLTDNEKMKFVQQTKQANSATLKSAFMAPVKK